MMNYSCDADLDFLVSPHSVHGLLSTKVAYVGLQQRYPVIRYDFSPQVTALWRLCVMTIIWAFIWEAGAGISTPMCNTPADLAITSACGVKGRPLCAPTVKCVRWQTPLVRVLKINIDGGAAGSPGQLTRGGIFRDHFGVFRGCFTVSHGRGYAFEAELTTILFAIELAHDKGWSNIWLESDSTYVVYILKLSSPEISWRLMRQLRPNLNMVISHIYREGNAVAVRLSREEVDRFMWWSVQPDFLFPFFQKDIASDFYCFTSF
ncbi:hypothetical protein ACS0TY_025253 [Phlomoides rotata]